MKGIAEVRGQDDGFALLRSEQSQLITQDGGDWEYSDQIEAFVGACGNESLNE